MQLRTLPSSNGLPGRRLLIMTHHKCGTLFLSRYLSELASINDLQMFHSILGTAQPTREQDISFLKNAQYDRIKDSLDTPAIHIIRNPLDIVVSAYHSHLSTHNTDNWPLLREQRSILASCTKEQGLFLTLAFLECDAFFPDTPGPLHGLKHWCFDDPRIQTIRMEDLVADVTDILGGPILSSLGSTIILPKADEFTFERMSGGRRAGEVDDKSHLRSGLPDTWRMELPSAMAAYIRVHFRALLERFYPNALV